jgi:hypothetical protein
MLHCSCLQHSLLHIQSVWGQLCTHSQHPAASVRIESIVSRAGGGVRQAALQALLYLPLC